MNTCYYNIIKEYKIINMKRKIKLHIKNIDNLLVNTILVLNSNYNKITTYGFEPKRGLQSDFVTTDLHNENRIL